MAKKKAVVKKAALGRSPQYLYVLALPDGSTKFVGQPKRRCKLPKLLRSWVPVREMILEDDRSGEPKVLMLLKR